MTVVSFSDPTTTLNKALSEILKDYFDGGTHEISDEDLVFPDADIYIELKPLNKNMPKPVITIIGLGSFDLRKQKCKNPNNPAMHGYELWATVLRSVTASLAVHGGIPTANTAELHRIWGLLHAIFSARTSELAAKNIFKCELPPIPEDSVPEDEFGIVQVSAIMSLELHLPYAAYNQSEVP